MNVRAPCGRTARPRKKPVNFRDFAVFDWVNKYLFRGRLSKKAPKKDMMDEFGKSKAKMINGPEARPPLLTLVASSPGYI